MNSDKKSVAHRVNFLSKATDCSFLVGQDEGKQRFEANKGVLGMVSPVFMAMFYGEQSKKGGKPKSEVIEIPDVSPAAFQMLLNQAYSLPELAYKKNWPSVDVALEILYVGHKYMIIDLENRASDYLKEKISAETIFVILQASDLYNKKKLEKFCVEFFKKNTSECLKTEQFLQATLTQLQLVFSCPELSITSEMDLLQALERYVEGYGLSRSEACKEKAQIEDVLKQIRFLSLDAEDFDHLLRSNLLTGDEKIVIAAHLINPMSNCLIPNIISFNRENRGMKYLKWCEYIKNYFDKHGNKESSFECNYPYCLHLVHNLSTLLWDCAGFNVHIRGTPLDSAFEKFGMEKNIQKVVESDNKELKLALFSFFEKNGIDIYKYYKN